MNGKDCLLAFADLDAARIAAANETERIRRCFAQQKKRRFRMAGAVCGCIVVLIAVAAAGPGHRFRQTPSTVQTTPGASERAFTEPSSAKTPSTLPGVLPPETQTRPSYAVPGTAPDQRQTTPSRSQPQSDPTLKPEPSSPLSAATEVAAQTQEASFEKAYRYALNDTAFASYIAGKVIAPERVADKICETSATAGWRYADGTMPETERLRCEIYRIADVDPGTAVCVRFTDRGEALTTDCYYVQLNPFADLSAVSDYVIPTETANGEE